MLEQRGGEEKMFQLGQAVHKAQDTAGKARQDYDNSSHVCDYVDVAVVAAVCCVLGALLHVLPNYYMDREDSVLKTPASL